MAPKKRRVAAAQDVPAPQDTPAPKRRGGRPPGEASTMVNGRLPLTLVAQLDRSLDRLERQTGLKANRGMIARRALALFVASHVTKHAPDSAGSPMGWSPITGMVAQNSRGDGRLSHRTGVRTAWHSAGRNTSRARTFFSNAERILSELSYCLHNAGLSERGRG